jgi:hypothetical protein
MLPILSLASHMTRAIVSLESFKVLQQGGPGNVLWWPSWKNLVVTLSSYLKLDLRQENIYYESSIIRLQRNCPK